MASAGKWVVIVVVTVAVLGVCIFVCDALLPWDSATRIGVGGTSGAAVSAVVLAWGSVSIGESRRKATTTPAVVNILTLSARPTRLAVGQALELDYQVQLFAPEPLSVQLGASLIGENGSEYFDRSGDRFVDLAPGTFAYHRQLRVPRGMPAGDYRLIVAVWHPAQGGRQVAKSDQGHIVQIAER